MVSHVENFEIIKDGSVFIIEAHLICPTLLEANEFKEIVKEQVSHGHTRLLVDISMCEHIDSTFIGAIIKSFKLVTSVGGILRIVKPEKSGADVFILTNTLSVFDLYDTREDALKSFTNFETVDIDGVTVIGINLTRSTVNEAIAFRKIVEMEINSGIKLVIDLSRCEYMDSTFFGVIIMSSKMMKDKGHKLKVVKPDNPAQDLFEITNTQALFDLYETREDALNSCEHVS
jgi:anti-sigma B factor antagonist/stage II sporulation protein AA (anti-sigma F factor antagonist)